MIKKYACMLKQRLILLFVFCGAAVFVLILGFIVRIHPYNEVAPQYKSINYADTVHDLTADEFPALYRYSGGSNEFYFNVFVDPLKIADAKPSIHTYDSKITAEYMTQRFQLKLPDDDGSYALRFVFANKQALAVYVNGSLIARMGSPGTAKADTEIGADTLECVASPKNGRMDIVLHIAQFYHSESAAQSARLEINRAVPPLYTSQTQYNHYLLILGALLCAGVFLLCMYIVQPAFTATLYFALIAFIIGLREVSRSSLLPAFPFVSGNTAFMLEYLTIALAGLLLPLYMAKIFPGRMWRITAYIISGISALYAVIIIFSDSKFYTSILNCYQAVLVVGICFAVIHFVMVMKSPNAEQIVSFFGIAVFFLAVVSDILMYNNIFYVYAHNVSVTESAMLVFVLAQMVSLFLANSRAVSDARAAEQRISDEKKSLETLNRLKTEFLGNASHELKTPLTIMSGYAQYSAKSLSKWDGADSADVQNYMKLITTEADRLALMVSQILDVTRIEENRLAVELYPCDISDLITVTIDTYYGIFTKNNNCLSYAPAEEIPPVLCDENRIKQVLVNLIANAARHTYNGTITISAARSGSYATISVADTGSGIAPERIDTLFERFGGNSSVQKKQTETGSGLGLFICKHIVKEHGGEIYVTSRQGEGTTVSFTLKLA